MRSIDLAVAHGEVFAAVYIKAVAVGVNHHIVYGTELATGENNAEMTATIDGHIPDKDIAAKLECYGFVASAYAAAEHHSGLFGISPLPSIMPRPVTEILSCLMA